MKKTDSKDSSHAQTSNVAERRGGSNLPPARRNSTGNRHHNKESSPPSSDVPPPAPPPAQTKPESNKRTHEVLPLPTLYPSPPPFSSNERKNFSSLPIESARRERITHKHTLLFLPAGAQSGNLSKNDNHDKGK